MRPANSNLPSRPKFSWDIRSTPWTDGKGNQEGFVNAVGLWEQFHEKLPAANSNRITAELRGICLKSQLYGRALDLTKAISDEIIASSNDVAAIVAAIYKRDALSVLNEVYRDFIDLLFVKRGATETFMNFEARFAAQVSKLSAHGKSASIHESLLAMMLLAGSKVDDSQRIPILSAAGGRETVNANQDTDAVLSKVKYEAFASVLRQCDSSSSSSSHATSSSLTANIASYGSASNRHSRRNNNRNINSSLNSNSQRQSRSGRPRMNPEELRNYKLRCICNACHMRGHWQSDHNDNGTIKDGLPSLPPNVPSRQNPSQSAITGVNNVASNNTMREKQHCSSNVTQDTTKNAAMSFTASFSASSSLMSPRLHGPLVDDGAPYSAIGIVELCVLSGISNIDASLLQPKPSAVANFDWWQYGQGAHASNRRRILGSVNITVLSDSGNPIRICHLVVDGSSQWVIGRNVTRASDILHYGGNCVLLPPVNNVRESIALIDDGLHSFIDLSRFPTFSDTSRPIALSCSAAVPQSSSARSWSETRRVIDKVHNHTCGHASFSDMRTLLQRNNYWNDATLRYLADVVQRCQHCVASSTPPPSRKVALGSLNRSFNDLVLVDHFFLDDVKLFHAMDSHSRYSAAVAVPDTSLDSAAIAFETAWVSQFWPPTKVQGDQAFTAKSFQDYLLSHDISFRPVPSRRHHKNAIESKHRVIRSIFLRLQSAAPHSHNVLHALHAVRISNDLYGSDTLSAFELAKGYTKPASTDAHPTPIHEDLISARDTLLAKRKLNRILRSHTTSEPQVRSGDLVQVFITDGKKKRGKWLSPRCVLSTDTSAGTVTVPGSNGKTIIAAVEDTRHAIVDDDFAATVVESIDLLSDSIEDIASTLNKGNDSGEETHVANDEVLETDAEHTADDDSISPRVGDRLEVYWPIDSAYYPGSVSAIDASGHHISYDDGDQEVLKLHEENWRSLPVNNANFPSIQLKSNEQEVLDDLLEAFGNKAFMRHQAQGFSQAPVIRSYEQEEVQFCKQVKRVPIADVPAAENVIRSHVIYKIKQNDDKTLSLKARIAPHGNEDSQKDQLRTECCMCPPSGVRIVLSVASLYKWRLTKADVKSAFLQTGQAQRDVYVVPPRKSSDRSHYWLLLTAAYGLVNANAKWQDLSDSLLIAIGLLQLAALPQLFYTIRDNRLAILVAKIVDDFLITGEATHVERFLSRFNSKFSFGTVAHGPGNLRFYGLNIIQDTDMTCSINAEDKLTQLEPYPITRLRRRQTDQPLNDLERSAFMSINSSIGWLGLSASPFCFFYASHLQQMLPSATVSSLTSQSTALRALKKLGTNITFPRPTCGSFTPSVVIFADAGRLSDHGQLSYVSGLLLGPLQEQSVYHTLSWSSHKSKRPVKSIGAAEVLAASEAIDEGKVLKTALSTLLLMRVELVVLIDSKDLYTSLSTRRNSIDKSIRADVNVIRFEYEVGNVDTICWLPGNVNLADPGTKKDSLLCVALQLLMHTGRIPLDLSRHESRRYDRPLG